MKVFMVITNGNYIRVDANTLDEAIEWMQGHFINSGAITLIEREYVKHVDTPHVVSTD